MHSKSVNPAPALENHYRIRDIAKKLGLSAHATASLFKKEPGVLKMGQQRITLLVPESVLNRVIERLRNPPPKPLAPGGVIKRGLGSAKPAPERVIKLRNLGLLPPRTKATKTNKTT